MLRREIRYFFTALMFFTRIPCPSWVDHSAEYLQKSRKYFPLIGWIVGGIGALVYSLAQWVLPSSIAVVLSMASTVWVTGAFHEDGFADVCDGFGGGWTAEQILTIMKDSRVGAYGVIGMGLLLVLKGLVLVELAGLVGIYWGLILLNGHSTSRWVASTFVQTHAYVQDPAKSKVKPVASERFSDGEMAYSALFMILPLVLLPHPLLVVALPIAYLGKGYLGRIFQKNIGGYTGDCLGATQQVAEVLFYLAILALWKYI
ncbi:MAG: adenosylcobinamide-GDP ribazoletransferase [Bacteroidota bacterium]